MAKNVRLQFRRGLEANIPTSGLQIGEPVYTTDSHKLYAGNASGGTDQVLALPTGIAGGDLSESYPNPVLAPVTRSNTTSAVSPGSAGTFPVIDILTTDAKGRVTSVNTKTVTMPTLPIGVTQNVNLASTAAANSITGTSLGVTGLLPDANIASAVTWNAKYTKPSTGIPASDLASGVIPTMLKNPYAITFSVGVSATYDGSAAVSIPIPAKTTVTPVMDGTAAIGADTGWATGNHVHPTDTSRAADSAVVKLTGDQTIAGTKTFSTSPIVPSKATAVTNSPTVLATEAQVYLKEATANKGVANGYASLDANAKVPTAQLPDFVLGAMIYGGTFVPSTATATLSHNAQNRLGTAAATIVLTNDTAAITGYVANQDIFYLCSVAGTFAGISLAIGDWLVSTGIGWGKVANNDAVVSVNGKTGAVTLTYTDVGAEPAFSSLSDSKIASAAAWNAKQAGMGITALGGTPTNITNVTVSAGAGTSTAVARADHTHGFTAITIPGSLPPNGAAGGVLAGTYPNPSFAAVARSNTTSTAAPGSAGTFTVIDSVTTDAAGNITAVNTKTVTMPTVPAAATGVSQQTNLGTTAAGNSLTGATIGVTGTLPVANGGTGTTTLTGIVKGNGTAAMTAAAPGTDYVIPSGNITGSSGSLTLRAMTADLHSWIPFGTVGLFYGEGSAITNAPDANWWRYIGVGHSNSAGYIFLMALPHNTINVRPRYKYCVAGTWSAWATYLTNLDVLPIANGGTGNTTGNAATVAGLAVNTSLVNNVANQIVRTNGSGYLATGYINTAISQEATASTSVYYEAGSDGYIRKKSLANFKTELAIPTSLANPYALTFTGGSTASYNGAAAVSVAIPTTLPPSGTASGDLSGSYPSPAVALISGTYSGSGGAQTPAQTALGKSRIYMSNETVNGNSSYKSWLDLEGYSGSDVGGRTRLGILKSGTNDIRVFVQNAAIGATTWFAGTELFSVMHPPTAAQVGAQTNIGITGFGAAGGNLSSGGTGAAGSATTVSRSDHTHTLPAYPTLAILGGQAALNRTVIGNDAASAAVTDTGGALSIPIPVTLVAPTPSNTLATVTTTTLRSIAQVFQNNLAYIMPKINRDLASTTEQDTGKIFKGLHVYAKMQSITLPAAVAANTSYNLGIAFPTTNISNFWLTPETGFLNPSEPGVPRHQLQRVYGSVNSIPISGIAIVHTGANTTDLALVSGSSSFTGGTVIELYMEYAK